MISITRAPKGLAFLLLVATTTCPCQRLGKTIELSSHKPNGFRESGTAFFLNHKGLAVTCYHVIADSTKVEAYPLHQPALAVNILRIDPVHDLAIIQVLSPFESDSLIRTPQISNSLTQQQLRLYGVLNGIPDSTIYVRATHDTLVKTGDLKPDGKVIFAESDLDVIPLDGLVFSGVSGSPVVDQSGQVIGVLSGSYAEGGTQAWAIPITYLPITYSEQPIDIRNYSWPPLQLMVEGKWGRLTRGLQLPLAFESNSTAITIDLDEYRSLLSQTEEAFPNCRSSAKALDDLIESFPDGWALPLSSEYIPEYENFRRLYANRYNDYGQKCSAARDIFKRMTGIQTEVDNYITSVQADLSSIVQSNSIKHLPAELDSETETTMQTVKIRETTAQNLIESVHARVNRTLLSVDSDPSDTSQLKAKNKALLSAANLLAGDDVREASKNYLNAMMMYESLVSDVMSYLSTSQ